MIETARTTDARRHDTVCRAEQDSRARGAPSRLRRVIGQRLIGFGERLVGRTPSSSRI